MIDKVAHYCERSDLSFWSEPINALTNLSFIIAGIITLKVLKQKQVQAKYLWLLALNMLLIGVGSFLYHTMPNQITLKADVFPIYLFQFIFMASYCLYALKFSKLQTGLFFIIYLTVTVLSRYLPVHLNHSEMYLPAIFTLLIFGVLYKQVHKHLDKTIMLAGGLFFLSLIFRTIDMKVCHVWPIGSHFMWHLLNAFVLFYCCQALINNHQQ